MPPLPHSLMDIISIHFLSPFFSFGIDPYLHIYETDFTLDLSQKYQF